MPTAKNIFLKTNGSSFKELADWLRLLLTKSRDMSPEFFNNLLFFTEASYMLKTDEYFAVAFDTLNKSRKLEADFTAIIEIEKTRRELKKIDGVITHNH